MLNERRNAARKVADNLFAVENAIDAALAQAGCLSASLPAARQEAGVSALFGQEAMGSTAEALMLLVQARAKIIEAHNHLQETRCQLGLRAYAVGDAIQKPPSAEERVDLRIVA